MIQDNNILTEEETDHLLQWASATPAQRLAWLEEVLQIAYKSGALRGNIEHSHQEVLDKFE